MDLNLGCELRVGAHMTNDKNRVRARMTKTERSLLSEIEKQLR